MNMPIVAALMFDAQGAKLNTMDQVRFVADAQLFEGTRVQFDELPETVQSSLKAQLGSFELSPYDVLVLENATVNGKPQVTPYIAVRLASISSINLEP